MDGELKNPSVKETRREPALWRWGCALLPSGSRRRRWGRRALGLVGQWCAEMRGRIGHPPLTWGQVGDRLGCEAVGELAMAAQGTVIFPPSLPWMVPLRQRSHHLAREFARQGCLAVYDCTGCLHPDARGFRHVEPNLLVFHGPSEWLAALPNAILWTFSYNFHHKDRYPESIRTVYDWIDDLEVFDCHGRDVVARNHRRAMAEADVVASVARPLHAEALRCRPDAVYLPNGVDTAHFAAGAELPDDPQVRRLRDEKKPVAGYYGALASWFDYRLLEQVARLRPDWNFLLIGTKYDQSLDRQPSLLSLPNVLWIGARPYKTLPGYLRLFDAAMIPFLLNDITRATSPLKLYEFFAAGKPVITTDMPECRAHAEVHVIGSPGEFSQALDAALGESRSGEYRERLRTAGRENSWANRVQTVLAALERRTPLTRKP